MAYTFGSPKRKRNARSTHYETMREVFDHLGAISIYSRFWLGVCSAIGVVVVVPVLVSAKAWQRLLAFLLGILPVLGLYESFNYLLEGAMITEPRTRG